MLCSNGQIFPSNGPFIASIANMSAPAFRGIGTRLPRCSCA
jgi:hypothetical protein